MGAPEQAPQADKKAEGPQEVSEAQVEQADAAAEARHAETEELRTQVETAEAGQAAAAAETVHDMAAAQAQADSATAEHGQEDAAGQLDTALDAFKAMGGDMNADGTPKKPFLPFGNKAKAYKTFMAAAKNMDASLAAQRAGGTHKDTAASAGRGKTGSGGGTIAGITN